ncbi:S-adenosylmethionine:tRNA ribosyltransferase-isomerase [Streptomyces diastaticus]|uniref:S-adenosylmethionine:tRNA ribosyltransferase-isomerase n=1 Tax=Streptomyces diastaticus TaxID=1956 RepID=UPI00365EA874
MSARAVVGRVPEELSARVPVEEREPGRGRDGVRLLVSAGERLPRVGWCTELPGLLRAGDLLVVNTSATLPAAADGRLGGTAVVVHFSTRADGPGPGERWAVELRSPDGRGTTRPRSGGPAGAVVALADGARLELVEPLTPGAGRLWWARAEGFGAPAADRAGSAVVAWLHRHARPIRYAYTARDQPLSAYRTVFSAAGEDRGGSAEMPSAGRPFTARTVTELVRAGVQFAPVTLHTGVASSEAHEPPYPEPFSVSPHAAWLVNAVRAGGGRVIAVGTTAVRALESAAGPDGRVRAASGWTGLVVTPERGVRCVDGLLTGLHEPEASHLLMLEAVAGAAAVERGYEAAVGAGLLWHEFGDVHLLTRRE